MSASKYIDKICIVVILLTLAVTLFFCFSKTFVVKEMTQTPKYKSTIFDTSYVHKIDIVMNDWDNFIENCESEEYSNCTVVIDGNSYKNTAIRAKGNTSLSSVRSMNSERYSFKLEFDHYEDQKLCDGLDKLCLNNLIQDNTMMKDYLVYQMMADFGADAPLCSYAYITVNGEDWGLYLAVEGVEDSFLSRNYGLAAGNLYKPDSMSFGGGRGNGRDFKMDDFDFRNQEQNDQTSEENPMPGRFSRGNMPQMPGNFDPEKMPQMPENFEMPGNMQGGFGARGSDDVKLKYIDDDIDSYQNIFNSAKTNPSKEDKKRLINSLKNLSAYTDLENTLDIEEVLRYFVVHNFVVNGDSYTGSMIHNYYLHEKDGKLSMIPWDYNLGFGSFQGGNGADSVNASIDSPVSGGNVDDRPMVGWIFSDEDYIKEYHQLFSAFVEKWTDGDALVEKIAETADLIRPYVEKDPTKFCTTEEFNTGIETISKFVSLRLEAVSNQLQGDNTPVDTTNLQISDMGTMNNGGKGGGGFGNRDFGDRNREFSNRDSSSRESGNSAFWNKESDNPEVSNKNFPNQILLGISILILGIGLFVVVKKRY